MVYVPTFTLKKLKVPFSSVTRLGLNTSLLVGKVTLALGMTDPEASRTVPSTSAVSN